MGYSVDNLYYKQLGGEGIQQSVKEYRIYKTRIELLLHKCTSASSRPPKGNKKLNHEPLVCK